jgi:two-component system sensor histidine kinase UhpB
LFAWLLNKEPDKILLIHPLDIDNRHIGELVIRNDLHRELELAAREAIRILLPWLLLFVLAGFALAQLLMALIHRLEPAVTGKGHEASAKHKMDWATALSFKKLTTRLVDAIDAIKQAMMLQGRKVVDVQEKERSKLANELHDELGQHLTAINFELDRLLQQDDPESLKATAAKLKQRSQRMSDILRSNLQLLRPPALDEYGLRYCLDELFNYWRLQHQGSELDVQIEAELQDADAHIQLTAYRIVQECLTNISRHAGDVVKAKVSMTTDNDWLVIEVADDGCGCQLEVVKGHYGLIGMRERVEALNGQFTVASQPGAGMQVSAMIPLVTEK